MGKLYKNDTKIRITRTVNQNITGATSTLIKYIKPDGTTGSWTAAVLSATAGSIYVDGTASPVFAPYDQSDKWKTWAYIVFSDGRYATGEVVITTIYEPGT